MTLPWNFATCFIIIKVTLIQKIMAPLTITELKGGLILKVILQQKHVLSSKDLEFYQNCMTNLSNKGPNFYVKIKQRHWKFGMLQGSNKILRCLLNILSVCQRYRLISFLLDKKYWMVLHTRRSIENHTFGHLWYETSYLKHEFTDTEHRAMILTFVIQIKGDRRFPKM